MRDCCSRIEGLYYITSCGICIVRRCGRGNHIWWGLGRHINCGWKIKIRFKEPQRGKTRHLYMVGQVSSKLYPSGVSCPWPNSNRCRRSSSAGARRRYPWGRDQAKPRTNQTYYIILGNLVWGITLRRVLSLGFESILKGWVLRYILVLCGFLIIHHTEF